MFCKQVLEAGGSLHPLIIDSNLTGGTGFCNPSILEDNGRLLVNIRHVGYTLFHSEKKVFTHPWGPCQYIHPEDDHKLRTNNFMGVLNDDFTINYYSKVDTSLLDKEPLWDFVGLEDGRLVRWNNKLYLSGVRRDTTPNGQGRMELSEIIEEDSTFKEISRLRIPAPGNNDSYCEKNWMPVLDTPYQYTKWCNPTEIVEVDPVEKSCKTVFTGTYIPYEYDFRGGSQVLTYGDYRFCIDHVCFLYTSEIGRKDAKYRHVFVVWDKNWNIVKYTKPFSFLEGEIEFCCGATFWKNSLLITFGFHDNSAFLLEVPITFLQNYLLNE